MAACGDDPVEQDTSLGEVNPDMVGDWEGTIDGSFGSGTFAIRLEADGSVSDGSSTVSAFENCPLENPMWGVKNGTWKMAGSDCDGTFVTLQANESTVRLQGSWRGEPSGNAGTFDILAR